MERKLLSLPSFFVLLLVAGIAFLATPVVDVQAQTPPTVTGVAVASPAVVDGKVQVTITLSAAVKVTTTGPPAVDAGIGFGREDLSVTRSITKPDADVVTDAPVPAGQWTLTTPASGATSNVVWTVAVTKPTNSNGSITVAIATTAAFQEAANTGAYVYAAANSTATHMFTDFDNTKPTVGIGTTATSVGLAPFLVTFTFTDAGGFAAGGPTFALGSINVTGGRATELGDLTGTASPYTVDAYVQANRDADEVLIGVAANAVMDAAGNGNNAVPHQRGATHTPPAVPSGTLRVAVDNTPPFVAITATTTPPSPTSQSPATSIAVTFSVKEGSATAAATKTAALNSTGGGNVIVAREVTVTGGTLGDITAQEGTFNAVFMGTITPAATATAVTISVNANAVTDPAGNGNAATVTPLSVQTGRTTTTTPPEPPDPRGPDDNDPNSEGLSGSVAKHSYIVFAADKTAAQLSSSITVKEVRLPRLDQFFHNGGGGRIVLVSPSTAVAKSVVISEIMWGIDKSNASSPGAVQWIELYHMGVAGATDTINLAGWKLKFIKDPTAAATTGTEMLIDQMSNQGFGWDFTKEQSGQMPGQSGRITPNNTLNQPVETIISAYRDIEREYMIANTKPVADVAGKVKDGTLAENWKASSTLNGTTAPFLGTPGYPYGEVRIRIPTTIKRSVVINELGNGSGKTNDWVELRNTTGSDVNIKKWELSILKAGSTVLAEGATNSGETNLVSFPDHNKFTLPKNGILVITNTHPRSDSSPLAIGRDINIEKPENDVKRGSQHLYYVDSDIDLPDDGVFTLILRSANNKDNTPDEIQDVVGTKRITYREKTYYTDMWPLHAVHVSKDKQEDLVSGKVWHREDTSKIYEKEAFKAAVFTGIGYDRKTPNQAQYGGTPGYANDVVKAKFADVDGEVFISEIMFMTGNQSPQWIEIYNGSATEGVNLKDWKLEVQNFDDPDLKARQNYTLTLTEKIIPPKQTVLIASDSGRVSNADHFPDERVYKVWTDFRSTAEVTNRRDTILSTIGFRLILKDDGGTNVVDEAGNLPSKDAAAVAWDLPGVELANEEGARSSIMRNKSGVGTVKSGWNAAVDIVVIEHKAFKEDTFYGHRDDFGTPGFHGSGGPLPVQLSSFYSKRNDAGAVIITWATESELDNAGFNLLRSSSRSGEFTKINAQLIPGAGTTGEKNTYTWTDTSAKPNVVYYYQIEDVSLDGEHRTLRTTRLRGHVGAHGKLTTTWGVLKSRD